MKLTEGERRRWCELAGRRLDPFRDRPIEEITSDDFGRLYVDSTVACGVYVVLDADDNVLYIGKVDRATGDISDRFRNHHAAEDDWDRVWIMPMVSGSCPCDVELAMIKHFAPPCNKAGVS